MAAIDWHKLYEATSRSQQPTPGYLFNDIVHDVSHASPCELPVVARYLADCVNGENAHVKLKALFVIKSLAYRVPPFCYQMQEWLPSVQEAAAFSGPPSDVYGDEPYRLVREAAEGALVSLTSGEYYHEQYRGMSRRIVGFGNYAPADDTVLPDGSIGPGRCFSYSNVIRSAVGLLGSSIWLLLSGVKGLFTGNEKLDALGIGDDYGGGEVDTAGARGEAGLPGTEYCDDVEIVSDRCYHPSPGSYVPPSLPEPCTSICSSGCEYTNDFDRLWEGDSTLGQEKSGLLGFEVSTAPCGPTWLADDSLTLRPGTTAVACSTAPLDDMVILELGAAAVAGGMAQPDEAVFQTNAFTGCLAQLEAGDLPAFGTVSGACHAVQPKDAAILLELGIEATDRTLGRAPPSTEPQALTGALAVV